MTYGSTDHRVPHLSGNQRLQRLTEPSKIRVGVRNAENGAMNWNNGAFRQGNYFNGKISETMKFLNLLIVTKTLAESIVHNPGIFGNNLFLGLVEEIFVKIVNEPSLTESLKAEINHTVPTINAGTSRGKV
jgi:hypothetical protein